MNYLLVKHVHMSCAALSISLFMLRGFWMLAGSPMLQRRWVKTLPHLVDSALLASALVLAAWSAQYSFASPWLTAKIVALIAYVVLGSIALKRGRTQAVRSVSFVVALIVFGYIVSVAVTKNPLFFL